MSQVKSKRQFRVVSATIATATASSSTLRLDDMASVVVQLPVLGTSGAVVQVWGNTTDTGTFTQLYGADGAASTITVPANGTNVGTSVALPAAANGLAYAKLVATSTNATTASASVVLKS